jgi:hypothetical protein
MSTQFSAKQPAVGYYYQIIRGLVLLLTENRIPHPVLSFEELDDISIEGGDMVDVYQTKYHQNKETDTTDRSSDFWKTIRVWSEGILDGSLDPNKTIFTLITTASISDSSFIHLFHTHNDENERAILTKMETIAMEKTSDTNNKGYQAFRKLNEQQKKTLIHNIHIVDSNVSIDDTLNELRRILQYTAPSSCLDGFIDSIMGWWFLNSVEMLLSTGSPSISLDAVSNQIQTTRDLYRADALPDDFFEAVEVSDEELYDSESKTYVKQLSIINATNKEKRSAISDYKRAYGQRSKWLRDGRVTQKDYDIFDSDLRDDWDSRFGLIQDESEGKNEQEKSQKGHEFYRDFYVAPKHNIPIFKNKGSYITKGSYQMLSDESTVGWHPDYKTILENNENVE